MHLILLVSSFYLTCKCQQPLFSCIGEQPFKNKDLTCADFSEVCVKKDDPDCESFQKTCRQCPPSNTTVKALLDHLKVSKDVLEKKIDVAGRTLSNLSLDIVETAQQLTQLEKQFSCTGKFYWTNILIFALLLVIIFILLLELRFKLCTKGLENVTKKERKRLYRSNQENIGLNINNLEMQKKLDEFLIQIEDLLEIKSLDNLNQVDKLVKGHSKLVIQFQVKDIEKPIHLKVTSDDNVVQIKRKIFSKCIDANLNYKMMQLKHKDRILDDNQYLLSNMESIHDVVQCEINNAINPSDIVVLKVHGNLQIPGLIQVNRNQTIADLKKFISSFNNSKVIRIFKRVIELNDEQTLENCALKDKDAIKVIEIENGHFIMHSIVGDADPILIEYSNDDLVSSVKKKLTDKLTCLCNEIILYYEGQYLDEEKFIYELNISRGSDINYWRLLNFDRLEISNEPLVRGNCSHLCKALDKISNKDLYIKIFKFQSISNWKKNPDIVNELRKCKLTKLQSRFVQVDEFYFHENQFGISMEYLGQSMRQRIESKSSFSENRIAKWSKQILEGLQILHQQKVVYRDLISSDIFLDADDNIKISVFGLSKFVIFEDGDQSRGLINQRPNTIRYPAPEVMIKKPFAMHSDVWSLGAILLEMTNGHGPYQVVPTRDLIKIIEENREFDCRFNKGVSNELQNFIRCCLKIDPKERPTVDELLRHGFVKSHNQ